MPTDELYLYDDIFYTAESILLFHQLVSRVHKAVISHNVRASRIELNKCCINEWEINLINQTGQI